MPNIEVGTSTARDVRLLAKAWQATEDEVIRRLLDHFAANEDDRQPTASGDDSERPLATEPETTSGPALRPKRWQRQPAPTLRRAAIHVEYLGVRTEAVLDLSSHEVTITSGPLAGRSFSSPSGAAAALIRSQNPGVSTERNGWQFWVVSETDAPIATIRT